MGLLRKVAALPEVKQARVASGVRADLALRDAAALAAYTGEFTGGQLKVAPEHCATGVLSLMRKPPLEVFEAFLASFVRQSKAAGREQYVVPYLMSGFPGCTDDDMRTLAHWLRQRNWNPRQTQCFIPTPGTIATAMFYCGKNEAGEDIYVARTDAQRLRQHGLLMPDRKPGDEVGNRPRRGNEGHARNNDAKGRRQAPGGKQGRDDRPDTRPDTRRDSRRDARPDARPDTRRDARRDARPDTRPDARPDIRRDADAAQPSPPEKAGQKSGRNSNRQKEHGSDSRRLPAPGRRA